MGKSRGRYFLLLQIAYLFRNSSNDKIGCAYLELKFPGK